MRLWNLSDTPTAIWQDASDATTRTIVTGVSELRDKSGNLRHSVQATTTAQPAVISASQNGLDVIRFNGTSHFFTIPNAAALTKDATELNVFIVAKIVPNATTDYKRIYNFSIGTALNTSFRAGISTYSNNIRQAQRRLDGDTAYLKDYSFTLEQFVIFHSRHNWGGATIDRRVFDDTVSSSATGQGSGATSATNSTEVGIGGSSVGQFQAMDFCEWAVIAGPVDADTREKIVGSLAWKWGLEASLPTGHPYETAAPIADPLYADGDFSAPMPVITGSAGIVVVLEADGLFAAPLPRLYGSAAAEILAYGNFTSPLCRIKGDTGCAGQFNSPLPSFSGEASNPVMAAGSFNAPLPRLSGRATVNIIAAGSFVTKLPRIMGTASTPFVASGNFITPKCSLSGTASVMIMADGNFNAPLPVLSGRIDNHQEAEVIRYHRCAA